MSANYFFLFSFVKWPEKYTIVDSRPVTPVPRVLHNLSIDKNCDKSSYLHNYFTPHFSMCGVQTTCANIIYLKPNS